MKIQSLILFMIMSFFGTSSAAVHAPEVTDTNGWTSGGSSSNQAQEPAVNKWKLIGSAGLALAHELAYRAFERVKLHAGQVKTGLTKVHAHVRSLLGFPPQPSRLVAGDFLQNMTAEEKAALKKLTEVHQHSFNSDHSDNQTEPAQKIIFTEAARIGILKTRIDTVLANENNYSDAAHMSELIKEVEGLATQLRETVEGRANIWQKQGVNDPEYDSDNMYLNKINDTWLPVLKKIQNAQETISSIKETPFGLFVDNLFGLGAQKVHSATRETVLNNLFSYLSLDSRASNATLPSWQLALESGIRKQAFALCKPILLKEYAPQSPAMRANVQQFLTDYESYQNGGVGKLRIRTEINKILGNSFSTIKPQPIPIETIEVTSQAEEQPQQNPVDIVESTPPVALHDEPVVPHESERPVIDKDEIKRKAIEIALAPFIKSAQIMDREVQELQQLLDKNPFDAQALKDVFAAYKLLRISHEKFSNYLGNFNDIRSLYNKDSISDEYFSSKAPYRTSIVKIDSHLKSCLIQMDTLLRIQDFLNNVKAAIEKNQILMKNDIKSLTVVSEFVDNSLPTGALEYVRKSARDLLAAIKEKESLSQSASAARAKYIVQTKTALERVKPFIDTYQKGFDELVEKINAILAKELLQETDIEELLNAYQALQDGVNEGSVLSGKLNRVSVGGAYQTLDGIGVLQNSLKDQLKIVIASYREKKSDLESLGINDLNTVMQTFTAVKTAINGYKPSRLTLLQMLNFTLKGPRLSPALIDMLSELVFWDSTSSQKIAQEIQKTIRTTAVKCLVWGLSSDQESVVKDLLKKLDEMRDRVVAVASNDKIQAKQVFNSLESFLKEVKETGVPEKFKQLLEGKINGEIREINAVRYPLDYIQEQVQILQEKLLTIVTEGSLVQLSDFRSNNMGTIKFLLSLPANSDTTSTALEQINKIAIAKRADETVFTEKLESLNTALVAMKSGNPTTEKKYFGPVLQLLFFTDPDYVWAQDAIQNKVLEILETAIEKEGFLSAVEKNAFKNVMDDYQRFKAAQASLQPFVGVEKITESQKTALETLKKSTETFIEDVITKYPNRQQAKANNPEVPVYVQQNFKFPLLRLLREGVLVKITALEKLTVVKDAQPDDTSDTGSLYSATSKVNAGDEIDAASSTTESFHTGDEGETREQDFEDLLPDELEPQVARAKSSIKALKDLATQFSVHKKSIDSIGLAEQGLAIVTAFENNMPPDILRQAFLVDEIEMLKLLFEDAINNQKLAVVASLQALRSSVKAEFEIEYPPLTEAFKKQVTQILTPQIKDSLSKDSVFGKFVHQELENLDSATETKVFFTVLDQEQVKLKTFEERYASQIRGLDDQEFVQALTTSKEGVRAALLLAISKLEDAYKLAIFKTLTDVQKLDLKNKNLVLYQRLESEDIENSFVILRRQFNEYIQQARKDALKSGSFVTEQVDERLQGKEVLGGVELQLGLYDHFVRQLQGLQNVDLAFTLYGEITPFYEQLKEIQEYLRNSKKYEIRQKIGFWKEFDIRARKRLWSPPSIPDIPLLNELTSFFKNPLDYLKLQEQSVTTAITGAQAARPVSELLEEAKELQKGIKTAESPRLKLLKTQLQSLESAYKPLQESYEQFQVVLDTSADLMLPDDAPSLSFEMDLKSPEGRQKTLEFIAHALSIPGSVYVPNYDVLLADRKMLLARVEATGKTTGQNMDQRYRDLSLVLRNDLLWGVELKKLLGKPLVLTDQQKKGMPILWERLLTYPNNKPDVTSLGSLLAKMNAELKSKGMA